MTAILVIDDDKALCRSLEIQLKLHDHEVRSAHSASEGLALLNERVPDIVLLDLNLPDRSGMEVLHDLKKLSKDLAVVMITGQQDMKATIQAIRSGAFDYIRKPFVVNDILLVFEKLQRFRALAKQKSSEPIRESIFTSPFEIVGADKKIVEVVKIIALLSRSNVAVMIEGESGTGKEMVARALHDATTPGKPFVAINCSAVVPTLLENELFGHEKGAFTGADSRKIGKLEFAGTGTVFLDEIGDMPIELQPKILRVLQERQFERVGGLESIQFNARVTAATNHDLEALSAQGKFRRDLFYRLAVSRITVPPLRDRRGDIPLLTHHLITRISAKLHRRVKSIEEEAVRRLTLYDWPGNVRELENVLTRAIALAQGECISADDLKFTLGAATSEDRSNTEIVPLRQIEGKYIEKALVSTGWNITETARLLQISPTTLRKKMTDFGLKRP